MRLIDADKIRYTSDADTSCPNAIYRVTKEEIDAMPTVDAAPVVHGEWVWVQYDANTEIGNFHCSKCGFIPATFNMINKQLNFCPNCGAKMDGKDGDRNE